MVDNHEHITATSELKKKPVEDKEENNHSQGDELNIDFSGIKNKLAGFFKSEAKPEHHHEPQPHPEHQAHHEQHPGHQAMHKPKEDELSFDFASITAFTKQHYRWLVPLLCILIAIFVSAYLRTMPLRMPITEDWAQNTAYNFYQNNIGAQINAQYPNLPAQNKNTLIDKEWEKFREQNKEKIKNDIAQLSQQYRSQFEDKDGTLYLLGIDPYHYYRMTYNILKYGHQGTTLKDGKPWDEYFLAPEGRYAGKDFHAYFGAFLHKLMNFFGNYPLMFTFFLVGTIFSALAVIPAFFIGKRITGNNAGGFFTALLVAVSAFFVQRTTGESSDTDVYVVFFPLLITWLFLEAFEAKELKKKMMWISLAGISSGIFSIAWGGWWYVFDFILATIGIYLVYLLAINYTKLSETIKSSQFFNFIYVLLTYFAATWIVSAILSSPKRVFYGLIGPFSFLRLKAVAVTSLWPNIHTTVAELNVVPIQQVIGHLGGKLLFALALVGIIFTFLKKDETGVRDIKIPIFLIIWFIASLYATTKGVRFILQATPVFAIAFGAFLGISWAYASRWISKELKISAIITQITVFILLSVLLIQPVQAGYQQAYQSVPSMNDGWYNALTKINVEGDKNAIVNSWWDFGHWFKAIANRPVTFDGAAQTSWGAHWIGKSLLTDDEKQTVGILRMLNCGQNTAFNELDKIMNNTHKEVEILGKIIVLSEVEASETLKDYGLTDAQVTLILKNTHCLAPTDYFITSDDMIGKAPVWGHFGSWNFVKAEMYRQARNKDKTEGIATLINEFDLSPDEADKFYYQIQNTAADQWVASWPAYISGVSPCQKTSEKELSCKVRTQQGDLFMVISLDDEPKVQVKSGTGVISPASLVYADKDGIKEKKFAGSQLPFSVILIPSEENYNVLLSDPTLAASTLTKLFFLNGHGMKCFSKFDESIPFTGGKISTWEVDYSCQQSNKVFFLPKEEAHAAHILITPNGRTEEEALKLATEIRQNLTAQNFGEYAQKYSEDPGSKDKKGDLGWFGKGLMIKPFEDAAFGLKPGEISEPVKSQYGYHLIYLIEKRES